MQYFFNFVIAACIGLLIAPGTLAADQGTSPSETNPKIKNLVPRGEHGDSGELPIKKGKFMFSVSLHKEKEIDSLLTRADELSKVMRTNGNESRIALILHGPEVKFFTRKNYNEHRKIVDRAEKLNDRKIIEVKICKTKLDEYGIRDDEIPEFIEIIPYAPDEEKRLLEQGYVYL